jgi:uncharacterized protein YcaQ
MAAPVDVSNRDARRLAIAAQGLARDRPKARITRRRLRAAVDTIKVIQLDAINVVARTQFLVLFSRVGAYDVGLLHDLTGPGGELFEYWAHAACLLPVADHPLLRWRMEQYGPHGDGPTIPARRARWRETHRDYIAAVLDEVRRAGPLAASQLSDPRRRDGEWWDRRSVGREALESLFAHGDLAAWRSPNFERVYDLPDRVIPAAVRTLPTPSIHEAKRALLLHSAAALGVATAADLSSYYMLNPRFAKPLVTDLAREGALVEVAVDGWRDRAYTLPGARPSRVRRAHATLVSPFDSLIWERARTARVFGFDYRIEVYVPEPNRTYGYYVLPLLLGEELVARFDLKADRNDSVLLVRGAFVEDRNRADEVAVAAVHELHALRGWLGLDDLVITDRGDLAVALRSASKAFVS